jgi:hypothetical protein
MDMTKTCWIEWIEFSWFKWREKFELQENYLDGVEEFFRSVERRKSFNIWLVEIREVLMMKLVFRDWWEVTWRGVCSTVRRVSIEMLEKSTDCGGRRRRQRLKGCEIARRLTETRGDRNWHVEMVITRRSNLKVFVRNLLGATQAPNRKSKSRSFKISRQMMKLSNDFIHSSPPRRYSNSISGSFNCYCEHLNPKKATQSSQIPIRQRNKIICHLEMLSR